MLREEGYDYTSVEEIRATVADGEAFRGRLTSEFGDYLYETVAREASATKYLEMAQVGTISKPINEAITAVSREHEIAAHERAIVRAAIGALLTPETPESAEKDAPTVIARLAELLKQGPPK